MSNSTQTNVLYLLTVNAIGHIEEVEIIATAKNPDKLRNLINEERIIKGLLPNEKPYEPSAVIAFCPRCKYFEFCLVFEDESEIRLEIQAVPSL